MNMTGFKIGSIRGIPIRIHFTFLFVLPLLALAFSRVFRDAARLAEVPPERLTNPLGWGLGIAVALFVSVLLHELAHSLYAIRKGGKVKDITLMMVGGVSQISEMPRDSRHEAMMAFVGPLLSIVLGGLLYGLHVALAGTQSFDLRFGLFYLGALNLFLGVFNLLPAFPMDGGRILRALLSRRIGMVRATQVSARVGKAFAVVFGLWGLFTVNMLLVLIAVFVYMGADGERRSVLVRELVSDLRVRDLMTPYAFAVPADASVYDTAERMLRERSVAFTSGPDGQPNGVVTFEGVQRIPTERRAQVKAREIAIPAPAVSPEDEVSDALRMMSESDAPQLAVVANGHVVGSIGREEVLRGVRLSELRATQPGASATSHTPPPLSEADLHAARFRHGREYPPRGTFRSGDRSNGRGLPR